jgi:menaquinone-dependent protoporphyrinogen IX oxidase
MNILVIYFSQSGQIRDILNAVTRPMIQEGFQVDFVSIEPEPEYPFPWKANEFFSVFPDSKAGNNCQLKPLTVKNPEKYDLIIIGLQVWYLEPSIPTASFLRSEYSKFLKNKPIITIYGIRNMWVNAHQTIKELIENNEGKLVGNIILADRHNNLVSVLTIVRWLINGKKEASRFLPAAGVSDFEILSTDRFGYSIINALKNQELNNLQNNLIAQKAIHVDYHIMKTEFAGSRIFGIWAKMINNNSKPGSLKRKRLLIFFKYYLYFVIFIVSPISSLIFRMIRLIFRTKTELEILKHTSLVL